MPNHTPKGITPPWTVYCPTCGKIGSASLGNYCSRHWKTREVYKSEGKRIGEEFVNAFPSDAQNFRPKVYGIDQDKFPMED